MGASLLNRFFLLLAVFFPLTGFCQSNDDDRTFAPLQEVFFSELVYPQEKNEAQISGFPTYISNGFHRFEVPLIVEYGITNNWQLELEWEMIESAKTNAGERETEIGGFAVGTKYSFMNIADVNFHMAFSAEIEVPVHAEDNWNLEPSIIFAKDFPSVHHSQVFAQLGMSLSEEEVVSNQGTGNLGIKKGHEMFISGGFFVPFDKWVFTSELSGVGLKDEKTWYYTPGVVTRLGNGWEAGFGMPIGLNNQADQFWLIAMLTFEFGLSEDED